MIHIYVCIYMYMCICSYLNTITVMHTYICIYIANASCSVFKRLADEGSTGVCEYTNNMIHM